MAKDPPAEYAFPIPAKLFNTHDHAPENIRNGGTMKVPIAAAAALVLSGCGLPPALTIASYAFDGMTLLATGKSVGDHALSAAVEKDCAIWRVIKNADVCRDYETEQNELVLTAERWKDDSVSGTSTARVDSSKPIMLALADPVVLPQFADDRATATRSIDSRLGIRMPSGPIAASFVAIERGPGLDTVVRTMNAAPRHPPADTAPIEAIEPRHEGHESPRVAALAKVLVVGSFSQLENAKRAARRWVAYRPEIIRTRFDGMTHHRVIVRPRDSERAQRQMASLGQHVWAADVCTGGHPGDDCVNLPTAILQ